MSLTVRHVERQNTIEVCLAVQKIKICGVFLMVRTKAVHT